MKPPRMISLGNQWMAPRVDSGPQNGRETREATCGCYVYVSSEGLRAIEQRGKVLVCDVCLRAWADEQGYDLARVDYVPDLYL